MGVLRAVRQKYGLCGVSVPYRWHSRGVPQPVKLDGRLLDGVPSSVRGFADRAWPWRLQALSAVHIAGKSKGSRKGQQRNLHAGHALSRMYSGSGSSKNGPSLSVRVETMSGLSALGDRGCQAREVFRLSSVFDNRS